MREVEKKLTSVSPHGGTLIDREAKGLKRQTLLQAAEEMPRLQLKGREISDLELIATGAYSPLEGFLCEEDYHAVLRTMRLASEVVWPMPVTLSSTKKEGSRLRAGEDVALYQDDRLLGVLHLTEKYGYDKSWEAKTVFRTSDGRHPGVRFLLNQGEVLLGGKITLIRRSRNHLFPGYRKEPAEIRALFKRRGWRKVVAFQTRNPIHRAHEYIQKCALEMADGLLLHPLVGETKSDDIPAHIRIRSYETLLASYYPASRTLLSVFPGAMRYAGPREAVFHALVRKNYGCSHFIVGRDHAGIGKCYGKYDAQDIFDAFDPEELGIVPLFFDHTFYCRSCAGMASIKTCPHNSEQHVAFSGSRVRELLRSGTVPPTEFTRPEVAQLLITAEREREGESSLSCQSRRLPMGVEQSDKLRASFKTSNPRGFTVWLTGLSGVGKTTLARELVLKLRDRGIKVEMLDGDEVRSDFSSDLGFSKRDRDTHIRRIGYVCRLLSRNSVGVVVAAISPYSEIRDEVRREIEKDRGAFIEVFVKCPIEVLTRRDVKGFYKKALAGEIKEFTGVSDPYEEPLSPDVLIETNRESIEAGTEKILRELKRHRLLIANSEMLAERDDEIDRAEAKPTLEDTLRFRLACQSKTVKKTRKQPAER